MGKNVEQPEMSRSKLQQVEAEYAEGEGLAIATRNLEIGASQREAKRSESRTDQQGVETKLQVLSKEVIAYLSKEIETITNNNNMFRARTSFTVFLGPFIVLGSFFLSLKGTAISLAPNFWTILGVVLIFAGYIGLAYMSARVEKHGWDTCNHYRSIIERLHRDPQSPIEENDLVREYTTMRAYLVTYGVMALAFIGLLIAVLSQVA